MASSIPGSELAERVSTLAPPALARSPRARRWVVVRRAAAARLAPFGVAVLLTALMVAALAPVISPHNPLKQNLDDVLARPSVHHPLGTDNVGAARLSSGMWG